MNQTSETPLLPGMKPVLELLRTDPQRIDLVFCKKGLQKHVNLSKHAVYKVFEK